MVPVCKKPIIASAPELRDWRHNTQWFRDGRQTWIEFVTDRALYAAARSVMLQARTQGARALRPVRVWSCGCSSGEELLTARFAYEHWVQPVFHEAFGRAPPFHGVGTDVSADILDIARDDQREWSAAALADVPSEILASYFVERPEPPLEREARLARDAAAGLTKGAATAPNARYSLMPRTHRDCSFWVEDTTALAPTVPLAPTSSSHSPTPTSSDSPERRTQSSEARPQCQPSEPPPTSPEDLYDIILCRYSIFLYCDEAAVRRAIARIASKLAPHGTLVLGSSDQMPSQGAVPAGTPLAEAEQMAAQRAFEPVPASEMSSPLDPFDPNFEGPVRLVNAWRLKQLASSPSPSGSGAGGAGGGGAGGGGTGGGGAGGGGAGGDAYAVVGGATSLQLFRKGLGKRPRFADERESPRAVMRSKHGLKPAVMQPRANGARAAWILKSSLKRMGLEDVPMAERAIECERRRQERLAALRAQRDATELAMRYPTRTTRAVVTSASAVEQGRRVNAVTVRSHSAQLIKSP